ncbi:fibroblast growth factor 22 [Spea bombifrons]|uniref:fibroblast growth factor 22 n=1 Tax=Spea bombifrons TaxID=233779 RepID=UPI00234B44E6|nr:fibroblast growth factor 22 [Spea bombifrons]
MNIDNQSQPVYNYKHLEGDVRWRRFYSATHYFLTIDQSGHVKGTRRFCSDSIFQIYSVSVGIVAIYAADSGLYLAMDKQGKVYGAKDYGPNCQFQERIEENGYNTYASVKWHYHKHSMYLAISLKGQARRGRRTRYTQPSTHFIPLSV